MKNYHKEREKEKYFVVKYCDWLIHIQCEIIVQVSTKHGRIGLDKRYGWS